MLFPPADSTLVRRLREIDPDRITPLEAIALLAALRVEAIGEHAPAAEPATTTRSNRETR
jgi:hypothetical protein